MEITGRLLTKNIVINLLGQLLPLFVAIVAIPFVIHRLGPERFGILSLAWVLLSYSALLDLGLGRATTKFVAEHLGRDNLGKLSSVVWTSVWTQLALGGLGATIFVAVIPTLVERFLKMPASLRGETVISFYFLAACVPFLLIGNSFRGVLEAGQRFDLVNIVRIPVNSSIFLLPAIALPFGIGLPGIVLLMVLARVGATLGYLWLCLQTYPDLRKGLLGDSTFIRTLLAYGGWVTVSNIVSPLMSYLDRFFIGSVVSVSAVGYYSAPYEAVSRATVLPSSMATTIFPAFSLLDATGSSKKVQELCVRSLKSMLLTVGPSLLLVVVFSRDILRLWLGPSFAMKSTLVLQIIALGTIINSLAQIPSFLLQGLGRPDLTAKFHLFELPLYVGLLWFLLTRMGIAGAALAWTTRVTIDAVLLFGAAAIHKWIPVKTLLGNRLPVSLILTGIFGVLLTMLRFYVASMSLSFIFAGCLLLVFAFVAWQFLLDGKERHLLISTANQFRGALAKAK